MKNRAKYKPDIPPTDKLLNNLNNEVFKHQGFEAHVQRVAQNLNVDPVVVRSVLEHYFSWITVILNTASKFYRRIVVYGFFVIRIRRDVKPRKK